MRKLIYLLTLMGVASCMSMRPKGFKYCYYEKEVLKESPINLDGYFLGKRYSTFDGKPDTSCRTILFYRDMSCATSYISTAIDSTEMKELSKTLKNNYHGYFKWGGFRISHDTIFTQAYFHDYMMWGGWMVNNIYKIVDRNTLVRIPSTASRRAPNSPGIIDVEKYDTIRFVYYPNRIDSLSKIKKYRWFKCKD